jgi:hypothetical protein
MDSDKNDNDTNNTSGDHDDESINKEKKKLGHREVKDGVVHYKKVPTDELKSSVQFGIIHILNEQNRNSPNERDDILMQDFISEDPIDFRRLRYMQELYLVSFYF